MIAYAQSHSSQSKDVPPSRKASTMRITLRSLLIGFGGISLVFVYSSLPEVSVLVPLLYIALTLISLKFDRFPLYNMFIVITLIKFFQVPDFDIYTGDVIGTSFRFAIQSHPVLKYADEVALILCFQTILFKTAFFLKAPRYFKSLRIGRFVKIYVAVVLLSALVNAVSVSNVAYYFPNWLRAFIVLGYMFIIPWSEVQIKRLAQFLITLAFAFQLVGSTVVNWPRLLSGRFSWIDDFTGTFMFPLCEWAAFLLGISIFMFLGEYFASKRARYVILALIAFVGIISASVGTMTIILIVSLVFFFGLVFIVPQRFGLVQIKNRLAIFAGALAFASIVILFLNLSGESSEKVNVVSYGQYMLEKRVFGVSSVKEIPKILAYYNLVVAITHGEINPLWGAGPAMYLSGIGAWLGDSRLVDKYSTEAMYAGESSGQAESQQISIVGLFGELGILGLFAFLGLLGTVWLNVWRKRRTVFQSEWHGLLIGTLGSYIFLMLYSLIQSPFDGWVEVLYIVTFSGCLLIVTYIRKFGVSYPAWKSVEWVKT